MTLLGVSTSALPTRDDLDALLVYEPDVVEFYNYPTRQLPLVERFCDRHGIRPALHAPVPYDGPQPLRRFAPTGPDPDEAAAALDITRQTVQYARRINALHVVVHFPSPYPPYPEEGFAKRCKEFLGALTDLMDEYRVPILVENLSAHPLLRTPEQYRSVLSGYPDLGFCLDVGHAHLMGEEGHPLAYAEALSSAVRSLHVYNTTPERYLGQGHELAAPDQSAADGYLDLPLLLPEILRCTEPAAVVMEHRHRGTNPQAAAHSASWLRHLIDQHKGRKQTHGG